MSTTLETAPVIEPVSLAEAKAQCRVTLADDDNYITALAIGAREKVEKDTRRALIEQTLRATLRGFPRGRIIRLERPQLISVTSIKYYDAANAETTLSASTYTINAKATPGEIELNSAESWPVTYSRADAVTILYKAGYGAAAAAVPQALRLAILQLTAHWYVNRLPVGEGAEDVPHTYKNLIGLYEANLP